MSECILRFIEYLFFFYKKKIILFIYILSTLEASLPVESKSETSFGFGEYSKINNSVVLC